MNTPEKARGSLRELYPAPEVRHKVHYLFAHQFIAPYVFQNPRGFFGYLLSQEKPGLPLEPTEFINSRWSEIFVRELGPELAPSGPSRVWGVADLSMSLHVVSGRSCALIKMPEPERPTEAHFIAVISQTTERDPAKWPVDTHARVLTLEKTRGENPPFAIVCERMDGGGHRNHAVACPAEIGEFLSAIASILDGESEESTLAGPPAPAREADSLPPPMPVATTPPTSSKEVPSLDDLLKKPQFILDPVFPKENYLTAFGIKVFRSVLSQINEAELIPLINSSSSQPHVVMFTARNLASWAIDLAGVSKRGMTGREEFIERAKDLVRRPPPEMAAFTVEQHILARGVAQIQVEDKPFVPGQPQIAQLKTVGWCVADLVMPQ